MARKAGRERIARALREYAPWRATAELALAAIGKPKDTAYLIGWLDDLRRDIEGGDLGPCTSAMAASILRDIRAWETGLYSHTEPNGGRVLAGHRCEDTFKRCQYDDESGIAQCAYDPIGGKA